MIWWFDCRTGPVSGHWVCLQASLSWATPRDRRVLEVLQSCGSRGGESSLCSLAEEHRMSDQLPWWFWPVDLFAMMLPGFRTMRHLCSWPKSATVNLHSVVSLNLIALLFFSFDTWCTFLYPLLESYFYVFFFFVDKLCLAGDEISVSCLLQTVGAINKCWQTKKTRD